MAVVWQGPNLCLQCILNENRWNENNFVCFFIVVVVDVMRYAYSPWADSPKYCKQITNIKVYILCGAIRASMEAKIPPYAKTNAKNMIDQCYPLENRLPFMLILFLWTFIFLGNAFDFSFFTSIAQLDVISAGEMIYKFSYFIWRPRLKRYSSSWYCFKKKSESLFIGGNSTLFQQEL